MVRVWYMILISKFDQIQYDTNCYDSLISLPTDPTPAKERQMSKHGC